MSNPNQLICVLFRTKSAFKVVTSVRNYLEFPQLRYAILRLFCYCCCCWFAVFVLIVAGPVLLSSLKRNAILDKATKSKLGVESSFFCVDPLSFHECKTNVCNWKVIEPWFKIKSLPYLYLMTGKLKVILDTWCDI